MIEMNNTSDDGNSIAAHEAAVRRAMREAILTHARLGRSVVGWKDGQLVWMTPEEVIEASKAWREGEP